MIQARNLRLHLFMALAAAVAAMGIQGARADDKPRAVAEIQKDITAAHAAVRDAALEDQAVNPENRDKLRDKLVPLLTKCAGLYEELYTVKPTEKNESLFSYDRVRAELAYFGDKDQMAALEKDAKARNRDDATYAKMGLLLVRWWNAAGNEADQGKVLDEIDPLLKTMPKSSEFAAGLKILVDENPASAAIASRVEDMIATSESSWAKSYNAMPNKVGKPLVVEGKDLEGKAFSTDRWKGKVVMVDFWATWCEHCDEQESQVIALYKKYHGKGLEIVAVNSDTSREKLEGYMKSHAGMAWPELFTEGNKALDPTTRSYGISAIPTAYFIDRDGILRATIGDREMEAWIEKLLAEKPETKGK